MDVAAMLERTGNVRSQGLPRIPLGVVVPEVVSRTLARSTSIVVIRAPRGAGKTSTVSAWLQAGAQRGLRHRWLTLPNRPVDRDSFWAAVLRAVVRVDVGPDPDPWSALIQHLNRMTRPMTLILDNFTQVQDSQVDDEILDLLGRYPLLSVVVLTRAERRIEALAAGFADGAVLRMRELALNAEEIQALARSVGKEVSAQEAAQLVRELTGWPALVRAVLRDAERTADGALIWDHAAVERYLRVILDDVEMWSLTPVLMALSTPRSFSTELAALLVGADRAEGILPVLVDSGFLVRSADQGEERFEALPRLRRAVQRIFRSQDPQEFARSHRIAAQWSLSGGLVQQGLEHAVEGGEWDTVKTLVERYWLEMLHRYPAWAREVLERVPEEEVHSSPRLRVTRDYLLRLDRWEIWEEAFREGRLVPELADSDHAGPLTMTETWAMRSGETVAELPWPLSEHGAIETAEDGLGPILEQIPELLLQWSLTKLILGEFVGAAYAFREAYRWAHLADPDKASREAACGIALSLGLLGHLSAAEGWLGVADALPGHPTESLEVLAISLVRRIIAIDRSLDLGGPPPAPMDQVTTLPGVEILDLTLRAAMALHHPESREPVLAQVEGAIVVVQADERYAEAACAGLVATAVDLHLAAGRMDPARDLIAQFDAEQSWVSVAASRIALFDGNPKRVLDLTEGIARLATTQVRLALELAVNRACAAWRLGNEDQAGDAWQHAVSLSEQSGNLRPFLMVPQEDIRALSTAFPGMLPGEVLRKILGVPEAFPTPRRAIELTARELQVVRAVGAGATLSATARQLFVSENTIKSQVRQIYRKLGVHTRDAAIERAQALGLIEQRHGAERH